jgi:hypothetical protein
MQSVFRRHVRGIAMPPAEVPAAAGMGMMSADDQIHSFYCFAGFAIRRRCTAVRKHAAVAKDPKKKKHWLAIGDALDLLVESKNSATANADIVVPKSFRHHNKGRLTVPKMAFKSYAIRVMTLTSDHVTVDHLTSTSMLEARDALIKDQPIREMFLNAYNGTLRQADLPTVTVADPIAGDIFTHLTLKLFHARAGVVFNKYREKTTEVKKSLRVELKGASKQEAAGSSR